MGRTPMNYISALLDSQKQFNYEILDISNDSNGYAVIKCLECNAEKTILIKSLYKNTLYLNKPIHSLSCSKYYMDLAKEELGEKVANKFHNLYRYSHERTCNPNNKDYYRYKGKFGFKDYTHYHIACYDIYKNALRQYPYEKLSIDRIDNSKGYEPNNIRFVDIIENLKNREETRPILGVNIITGEKVIGEGMPDFIKKIGKGSVSGAFTAIDKKRVYLKEWDLKVL